MPILALDPTGRPRAVCRGCVVSLFGARRVVLCCVSVRREGGHSAGLLTSVRNVRRARPERIVAARSFGSPAAIWPGSRTPSCYACLSWSRTGCEVVVESHLRPGLTSVRLLFAT